MSVPSLWLYFFLSQIGWKVKMAMFSIKWKFWKKINLEILKHFILTFSAETIQLSLKLKGFISVVWSAPKCFALCQVKIQLHFLITSQNPLKSVVQDSQRATPMMHQEAEGKGYLYCLGGVIVCQKASSITENLYPNSIPSKAVHH